MNDKDLTYILNKGMKVFSQLYVGLCGTLGFATPYENNAAFRKRKVTIDIWCGESALENNAWVTKPGKTQIIDNIPREGFKITDDVKRVYWGGGNVVWRVLDPYGFELEIQSANLLAIINTAGIKAGGEIPGKCVWGRDGKDNILLHESSKEYQTAILAAETIKKPKTVGSSDRKVGHKYLLMDGSIGTYLGKFWVTKRLDPELVQQLAIPHDWSLRVVQGEHWHRTACPTPFVLGELSEFEGILFDKHSDSKKILLYKKAPLVREEVSETNLTEQMIVNHAKTARLGFASSAIKGEPVILTRHKPVELFWETKSINPDKFFKEREYSWKYFEDEYDRLQRYHQDSKYKNIPEWSANFEQVLSFDTVLIGEDGTFYGAVEHLSPNRYNINIVGANFAGPIVLDGPKMTIFNCKETFKSYGRHKVKYTESSAGAESVRGIKLPEFSSPYAMKRWIIEMINMGRIVQIVPAVK